MHTAHTLRLPPPALEGQAHLLFFLSLATALEARTKDGGSSDGGREAGLTADQLRAELAGFAAGLQG
jgi:predicted alpha/beta-hydrolase family hydrolase